MSAYSQTYMALKMLRIFLVDPIILEDADVNAEIAKLQLPEGTTIVSLIL